MMLLRKSLRVTRSLVVLLVLLSGAHVPAAHAGSTAVPAQIPNPLALDAEWWQYFVVEGDIEGKGLATRFATFLASADQMIANAAAGEAEDLAQVRASIERHFGRYQRISHSSAPPPPQQQAVKPVYPLDDLLELGREIQQLERAADLEAEEIMLLERSRALGQDEQDARKLRYRDLTGDDPARLLEGLRLIRDRLRVETLEQELRWRRGHQAGLVGERQMQLELLKAASERIECTTEAVASWQAVEREAADQVERASADLMKLQLSSSIAIATSPVERAAERRHDLKTLKRATEIAVAEVRRAGAVLAQRLLTRVAAANKTDPRADRTALKAQMADLDAKTVLLGEHGERTRQLRSAIAVEQAASDEPAVEQGYAAARKELAALEAALEDLAAQLERARQLARMLDARLLAREGAVGQGVRMVREGVSSGWSEAHALLARPLFEVNETPVTTLGLIRVAVILTLAWWLSRLLRGALARLSRNNLAFSPASLYAVGRVLHYLLLLLGFVVGLSSIGVDLTKFALFASALGVGVGFGLQTLISNFVAGLIILFEKSLNVGDFIELESGKTGEVVEINMRATRITTNDNVDILVPNAEFMNTKVTNWTLRDSVRRVHVPFSVAYGTDKELVREAALAAAAQVDHTLTEANRQAQVWLVRFGESSLDFELVVWLNLRAIKRPGSVLSDYLWALESELVARRIEIPFPQRELRWHGAFAGQGRGAQT